MLQYAIAKRGGACDPSSPNRTVTDVPAAVLEKNGSAAMVDVQVINADAVEDEEDIDVMCVWYCTILLLG